MYLGMKAANFAFASAQRFRLAQRLGRLGMRFFTGKDGWIRRLPSLGARWTDPSAAVLADVDVVAPCALGGAIDEVNVRRIRARIVCGAANNQLAHDGLADDLAARGILYAPDYIVNAGGLINISVEFDEGGYDAAEARRRVDGIERTMNAVLAEVDAGAGTPLTAADRLARRNLGAAAG